MRALAATLAVLLLVAICSVAGASLEYSASAATLQKREAFPDDCCTTYTSRRIPLTQIRTAYRTRESCPNPAVVLVTRAGEDICTDPEAPWVQEYLELLAMVKH